MAPNETNQHIHEALVEATKQALATHHIRPENLQKALATNGFEPSGVSRAVVIVREVEIFHSAVKNARNGRNKDGTLPDVTVEARHRDPSLTAEDISAAQQVWVDALARAGHSVVLGHPYADPLERLRDAHSAAHAAPILVSHPLGKLIEALEGRSPVAAYVYLRDTAEGVVRLAWLLLVRETLEAALAEPDLSALDPTDRKPIASLMGSISSSSFSLGQAVWLLGGRGDGSNSVLAQLCRGPWAAHLRFSGELYSDLKEGDLSKHLKNLATFRNKDFGHGIIGNEHRLHRLLKHGATDYHPVSDVASLLVGLALWFNDVGDWAHELGWPGLFDPTLEKESTAAPQPIAWLGGGAPLWVLDKMERDCLRVLDVLDGGGSKKKKWPGITKLAELLEQVAGRPLPPHEDMNGLERLDAGARATWEARKWSTPLTERVHRALQQHAFIQVVGTRGTGKSFLLREVERTLWKQLDSVVLAFRGHAGIAIDSAKLLSSLFFALKNTDKDIRKPVGPSGEEIIPDVSSAHAWWSKLADGNPHLSFVVLLDALEDMVAKDQSLLSVLPRSDTRYRIVLASRPLGELVGPLSAAIDEMVSDHGHEIDLDSYYASSSGSEDVAAYLRTKFKKLAPRHGDILAGARRGSTLVFLHAFHLARGYEIGFQPTATEGVPSWSYSGYLTWLESRVWGHGGYVQCLRAVLLTLADVPVPINQRTLRVLMGAPRGESQMHGPGFIDLLPWVLRDLEDFISRRRPPAAACSPAEDWASQVTWFDASVRPVDASVLEPAHAELRTYLRSDELPESWQAVRSELRAMRHDLAIELLTEPVLPSTSEARYLYGVEAPGALEATGTGDSDVSVSQRPVDVAKINAWRRHLPTSFIGTECPRFWVSAIRGVLELSVPAAISADLNLSLGKALAADLSTSEALNAFRAAAAAARSAMGIAGPASPETKDAVLAAPQAAKTLAAALEAIGHHYADRNRRDGLGEVGEALDVRQILHEHTPGVRDVDLAYADTLALAAFAHTRTGSVGRMIWTGGGIPEDLSQVGKAAGICAAHLGVEQPLSERTMRTASVRDPEAVLRLARILGLGIEVAITYDYPNVVRDIVRDMHACLAVLPPPSSNEGHDVAEYERFRPIARALGSAANGLHRAGNLNDAIALYEQLVPAGLHELLGTAGTNPVSIDSTLGRDLAEVFFGFNEQHLGLARAYRDSDAPEECKATVRRGIQLLLGLAALPAKPTEDDVRAAISRRPDAMKTLVKGLLEVPQIMGPLGHQAVAVEALEVLMRVARTWTGLASSATTDRRGEVARAQPWAHQGLAQALEQAARYRAACGDPTGAREALHECLALLRASGSRTYPHMPELMES